MDLFAIVSELREELARMDNATLALERLALARGTRRGRSKATLQAKQAQGSGPDGDSLNAVVPAAKAGHFRKTLVKRKTRGPA